MIFLDKLIFKEKAVDDGDNLRAHSVQRPARLTRGAVLCAIDVEALVSI